jgi:hypothetical protein
MKRNSFFLNAGLVLFLGIALISPIMATEEEDDEKALKQAMEVARKQAAKAGIKIPDTQGLQAVGDDANKNEDQANKTGASKTPAVTLPLTTLPEWIPALPEFRPAPNATRKQKDGVETGKLKGTSSASPDAIAESWHTAATAKKMSFGRTDSDINGKKSVRVSLSDLNGAGGEVQMELVSGKATEIDLTYQMPMPTPSPASQ